MQQSNGCKNQTTYKFTSTILNNPIELLKTIKEISLNYKETKHPMRTLITTLKYMLRLKQHQDKNLDNYIQRFKAAKDMLLQQWGGQIVFDKLYLCQ